MLVKRSTRERARSVRAYTIKSAQRSRGYQTLEFSDEIASERTPIHNRSRLSRRKGEGFFRPLSPLAYNIDTTRSVDSLCRAKGTLRDSSRRPLDNNNKRNGYETRGLKFSVLGHDEKPMRISLPTLPPFRRTSRYFASCSF